MEIEEHADVLICGSGSAGLCAGIWLSRFGISYKMVERRSGPLSTGQADGVQTRTVEIFDSFGLAESLLRDAYHVLEIAFWSAPDEDPSKGIRRTRYAPDKETKLSHQPHVILNQATINALMIGELDREIEYSTEVTGVTVEGQGEYPVRVTATGPNGNPKMYRAKYALACDGAHSTVRRALGIAMVGDSTDAVWGVMDVFPVTSFPDIRRKAIITAPGAGSIILIPREGDAMVRFYTELPAGARVADVTLEKLQERVRGVLAPYEIVFAKTAWWSAYAIGQRHADAFDVAGRVFLTGDACHTHSPKAGQGMNVSLQDGHNIGWKLGMVLSGRARPELLGTYVVERERTAVDLIEFDRAFAKLFSSAYRKEQGITPEYFAEQIVRAGRYTAGQAVHYGPSLVTSSEEDTGLAVNVTVGMRFPSAQVVRFCDAKAMQLVKGMPADGQWFVVVFAGDLAKAEAGTRLRTAAETLEATAKRFTPAGLDPDRVIDRILVLASDRKALEQEQIPDFFAPVTGEWKIKNLFKTFVDDESYNSGHGHAYAAYGIDPKKGAIVAVRPDHYVAKITSLEAADSISSFFEGFLVENQVSLR